MHYIVYGTLCHRQRGGSLCKNCGGTGAGPRRDWRRDRKCIVKAGVITRASPKAGPRRDCEDGRSAAKTLAGPRRDRRRDRKCNVKIVAITKASSKAGPRPDRKVRQKLWRDRITPFGLLKL